MTQVRRQCALLISRHSQNTLFYSICTSLCHRCCFSLRTSTTKLPRESYSIYSELNTLTATACRQYPAGPDSIQRTGEHKPREYLKSTGSTEWKAFKSEHDALPRPNCLEKLIVDARNDIKASSSEIDIEFTPGRTIRNSTISSVQDAHTKVASMSGTTSLSSRLTRDSTREPEVAPYETHVYLPIPSDKAVVVSPTIVARSSPSLSTASPEPHPFPGTMSSRTEDHRQSRHRQTHQQDLGKRSTTTRKRHTPNFGERVKLALKDMFSRDAVDEATLERIEDQHWTDELDERRSINRKSVSIEP